MSKKLVAYFSATGTTKKMADALAEMIGADLYEIQPENPYTKADLNWMNKKSRSSMEMQDLLSRPAIIKNDLELDSYDTVLLGFPIWWYVAPHIINTFLESHDFSRKTIILFATSGSSGFGRTLEELENSVKGSARITEGIVLKGFRKNEKLKAWVQEME